MRMKLDEMSLSDCGLCSEVISRCLKIVCINAQKMFSFDLVTNEKFIFIFFMGKLINILSFIFYMPNWSNLFQSCTDVLVLPGN